jgi:hypothetical protein
MTSILRSEALAHASAILEELTRIDAGAAEELRTNTLKVLLAWPNLRLEMVPEVTAGGCSIGGEYRRASGTDPATLLVATSTSERRRNFSALHEFGHHLQRTTMSVLQRLAVSPNPDALEEAACEVFAARILLPDKLVDPVFGPRGPTAEAVAELYRRSEASRAACCVRAAERLQSPGAVSLLDYSGIVNFAIGREIAPPARNSDQSSTALIAAGIRRSGQARATTQIWYRTGSMSEELYGDLAPIDGWLVAVTVRDRPAWQAFAPPRPGTGSWAGGSWWTCTYCDEEFQQYNSTKCTACGEPRCPTGHCRCTSSQERPCAVCGLVKHRNLFDPSTPEKCVDCS